MRFALKSRLGEPISNAEVDGCDNAGAAAKRKALGLARVASFPPVALRVMEELNHKEPDVNRVVGWIQSDPSFSAELLKVANSALYGFSYEIVSIRQAAIALGYDFVQSLAMTVGLA